MILVLQVIEVLLDPQEIKVFQVTQDNEVQLVMQGTVVQLVHLVQLVR